MKPRRQVKPQQKSFFGFTRINKLNEDPTQTSPIYHLLTPIANAKPEYPTAKYISIFGNQILLETGKQQPPKTVNPLYKFYVFRLVLTDYISYDFKTTAYKVNMLNDLVMYMNDQKDKEVVEAIREVGGSIIVQVFQSKAIGIMTEIRKKNTRAQRLELYKELLDQEGEKYAEMYAKEYAMHLEVKNGVRRAKGEILPEEKVLVTKAYARTQIQIVKQIEPLRYHQQIEKLKSFCDTHRDFFGTELRMDNRFKPVKYSIKINSPLLEAEPVLIRLDDFMELRAPDVDYKMEYLVLARDILSDLNKYRTETSEKSSNKNSQGCENYYLFLSPETVIVDQMTLRAKLSYQLPVRHALGLMNKPCSTENRLAFFCTPKEFDFYQSQAELEAKTKLILDDPHFGHKKMYARLSADCEKLVSDEKRLLAKLKQNICVDRYLLLCHKMFYNREFGKTDVRTSYKQIKDHFGKSLKNAKTQIRQNPQKLSIFIDPKAHKKELQSFDFTFDELVDFMQFIDLDSAVQSVKHSSLLNFLQLKSTIAQKLVNILKDDYFFTRVSNPKKYIIIFFIAGIQYLEDLRSYWTVDPKCYPQIPKLMGGHKEKKNKPKAEVMLKNTFNKIEEYKERDQNKEDKYKFLVNDELGKKLYEYVVRLNKKIEDHRSIQKDIADWAQRKEEAGKREMLESTVKETLGMLDNDLQLFKEVLFQFCYSELQLRYKDSPQRLPTFQQKETGKFALEYYKQVSRRFGLILKAFLTCRPDNYVIYDTILAKMLRFSEEEPKYTTSSLITEQSIKKERSFLFTIDDVLSYTTTAPKTYKHILVTKNMIEGQLYTIKDDSVFVNSKFKNPNKYIKKDEGKEDDQDDEMEEAGRIPVEDKFFKKMV